MSVSVQMGILLKITKKMPSQPELADQLVCPSNKFFNWINVFNRHRTAPDRGASWGKRALRLSRKSARIGLPKENALKAGFASAEASLVAARYTEGAKSAGSCHSPISVMNSILQKSSDPFVKDKALMVKGFAHYLLGEANLSSRDTTEIGKAATRMGRPHE
mgnify:CR=1 FL=1